MLLIEATLFLLNICISWKSDCKQWKILEVRKMTILNFWTHYFLTKLLETPSIANREIYSAGAEYIHRWNITRISIPNAFMFSERSSETTKSRSVVYINNLTCTLFRTSCAMQLNLRSWITGYSTAEMGTKTYWITRRRCSIRGPLFTTMCLHRLNMSRLS